MSENTIQNIKKKLERMQSDLPCIINVLELQKSSTTPGDCQDILTQFPDSYVDLICLDPPFNSNQDFNQIFKNSGLKDIEPQIRAFDDTWNWNPESADRVKRVKSAIANPAAKVIEAFEICIPASKMLAYTSYMAERLYQMHRILKDTGSLYLHCDPFANYYLRLLLDSIFGKDNFRNEIVWSHQGTWIQPTEKYPRRHDTLLFYTKTLNYTFNLDYEDDAEKQVNYQRWRKYLDGNIIYGRNMPTQDSRFTTYLNKFIEAHGRQPNDDDPVLEITGSRIGTVQYVKTVDPKSAEDLGYPTQKPLALYERIIRASSKPGHIVLDPFCGCGTTVVAARVNDRKAIGIDILPFALELINGRFKTEEIIKRVQIRDMPIQGVPVDRATAYQLAHEAPFKFQDWAISLVHGFAANPKKTGDDGIDGFGLFRDTPDNMDAKAILVQVTGAKGQHKSKYERLQATMRNHNAAMGVFITLNKQHGWTHTLPPVQMGVDAYPALQCFSIDEYYQHDKKVHRLLKLPPLTNPWTGKPFSDTQLALFSQADT